MFRLTTTSKSPASRHSSSMSRVFCSGSTIWPLARPRTTASTTRITRESSSPRFAGDAGSSGQPPHPVEAMGGYAAGFVGALGLSHVDVVGFSIGGSSAQALTLRHPALVRRLMLVGTGPRAGEPPTDPKYSQYGTS